MTTNIIDNEFGIVGIIIALVILLIFLLTAYFFIGYENLVNLGIIFVVILSMFIVLTFLLKRKKKE